MVTEKKILGDGFTEIETTPSLDAELFPEFTSSQFKVSKEKKDELYEEAKKEAKESGTLTKIFDVLPIPGQEFVKGTEENLFVEKTKKVEKEAFDNKIKFLSETIGAPVENIGLDSVKDQALAFTLSRYEYFKNRKKTFLEKYPEGDYQRIEVNFGEENPEKIELFKYNKNDKTFKISNPYGRDWAEVGRMAGTVLDEQFAGELLALGTKRIPIWGQLPPTVRVAIGNYLGIKGKELNKFLAGKGEEEYDIDELKDLDISKVFTDGDDYINSLIAAGLFKTTKEIGNYFITGKKPGMIDIGPEMIKAAESLDLEPLVFAQLLANPLIKRIYTQSGEFVTRPGKIVDAQIKKLEDSLYNFGLGKGDKKLDAGQLHALNEELALKVANDIKFFDGTGINLDEANTKMIESLNRWNKASIATSKKYTNEVVSSIGEESADINIYGLKQVLGKELKNFITAVQPKDIKVKVDGETVFKTPKKQPYGFIPSELQAISSTIKKMDRTISSIKDGKLTNFKTLIKLREDLHKVTYTSKDPKIIAAAENMHNSIKRIMSTNNKGEFTFINGSDDFLKKIKILDSHMLGAENIRHLSFFKEAITKGGDIDQFVQQFIRPNGALKLTQIKNVLTEGASSPTEQKAANETFNVLKKAWFNSVIKSDDGLKLLDKFVANDQASLKLLLGDGYMPKVDQMKSIISKQNQLVEGIVSQALKGNQKELYQNVLKLSNETNFGSAKEMDQLILDLGGLDSNALGVIRYEIINDILNASRKPNPRQGKEFLSETLDPNILTGKIRDILANDNLIKVFGGPESDMIKGLKNYNLYTTALAGGSDTGNSIAAGGQAAGFVNKFSIVDTGFTLLKYDLVSRLLSTNATSKFLKNLDIENPLTVRNLELISDSISSLAKDVLDVSLDENKAKDQGILYEYDDVDKDVKVVPPSSSDQAEVNVNSPVNVSRLSQPNIAPPIGAGAGPKINTMAGGPSTMNLGQQLFGNNPREITFAAKGGIMNTMKATQRVL